MDSYTSYLTPELLKNIQIVDVTGLASGSGSSQTLDLRNADAVEVVVNDGSLGNLTFNNVGGTLTDVAVNNTAAATTVNLAAAADLTEIDLNVSNVMATSGNGADISIPTAETININSHDLASSIDLIAAAANTITVIGDADLTVGSLNAASTKAVELVDASLFEGDLSITLGAQSLVLSTTDISVLGGLGNDTVSMTGVTQDYIVELGSGNDTLVDTGIAVTDTVVGGEGTDTLSTTFEQANVLAATVNGVDGIDVLSLSNDLNGSINAVNVDSTINTVTVAVDGSAGDLTQAASTIVGGAGEFTVNLGTSAASNAASLGDALTINDTGSATTDTLNLNNTSVNSSTNTNVNVFSSTTSTTPVSVTVGGYENVVLSTGTASPVSQTIGTLAINVDNTNGLPSAAASLTVNGTNQLSITSLTTNSTGLFTVDASALDVLSSANGVTISGTTQGVGGTASITGSAGNDVIDVGNYASTIVGGTGNDNLTGGTAADSITGDEGADTLSGAGGNDTIHGGAGNDTITEDVAGSASITGGEGNDVVNVGAVLSSGDVVDGGDGVDTLSVTAAITGTTGVGVSNFEVLQTTADQVMTNTINNSGWTTVFADAASVAISNALAAVTTYQVDATATTTHSFARLVDTATDSLTIQTVLNATPADNSITTFTANEEESITFDTSAGAASVDGALAITTLNAADLKTLTATGDHSVTVTTLAGATGLTTITNSLSANTLSGDATFTINAGVSTSAVTFTANGSSTGRSTVTTGSGADVITAALAAELYATGGDGNDTITGGNLADSLNGGSGADSLVATAGADTLWGGAGSDTITGGTDLLATFSASDLNGIADGGTINTTGVVINLGSTTLTAAEILSAASSYTANGNTSVAANQVAYLSNNTTTDGVGLSTSQDTLSNIRIVIGSDGIDYIVGSASADTISGGSGADIITGGSGNDNITGGTQADNIDVGTGTDTVTYTANAQTVTGTISSGSSGNMSAADVITSLAAGDVIALYATAAVVGTTTLAGTTELSATTAGGIALVTGVYNASTDTWTTGAASSTNDDLLIQWADGTSVNSIVLSGDYYDAATTVKLVGTDATDILTITAV